MCVPNSSPTFTIYLQEKFEGWWIYLADRKTRQLITKPIYIATLQTEEEVSSVRILFSLLTNNLFAHSYYNL